jgi:hypothetical protein
MDARRLCFVVSSLTASTAGTAEPSRRGTTLAVHSMLGYVGGFIGPLLVGLGARPLRRDVVTRLGAVSVKL